MASDDVPYVELEIPARYKMKRALKGEDDSLKYSYEAWRVLRVDPDASEVTTISNSASDDYKTERNAKKQAASCNRWWTRGNNCVYVARKCRITVEPIEN